MHALVEVIEGTVGRAFNLQRPATARAAHTVHLLRSAAERRVAMLRTKMDQLENIQDFRLKMVPRKGPNIALNV